MIDNVSDPDILKTIIWAIIAILTVFIAVFGVIAKWAINNVLTKMDEFLDEVRNLNEKAVKHDGAIEKLSENDKTQDGRLNKHGSKLQELELSITKCQSKNPQHVAV